MAAVNAFNWIDPQRHWDFNANRNDLICKAKSVPIVLNDHKLSLGSYVPLSLSWQTETNRLGLWNWAMLTQIAGFVQHSGQRCNTPAKGANLQLYGVFGTDCQWRGGAKPRHDPSDAAFALSSGWALKGCGWCGFSTVETGCVREAEIHLCRNLVTIQNDTKM